MKQVLPTDIRCLCKKKKKPHPHNKVSGILYPWCIWSLAAMIQCKFSPLNVIKAPKTYCSEHKIWWLNAVMLIPFWFLSSCYNTAFTVKEHGMRACWMPWRKKKCMQYVSSPWKRNITDPGQWLASINVTVNSSPVLGTRMIRLSPTLRHCSRCALTWNHIFICSYLFLIISTYINHQILLRLRK